MGDENGWLIGFKSEGSITKLENKRIKLMRIFIDLITLGYPEIEDLKTAKDPLIDLNYKNLVKNSILMLYSDLRESLLTQKVKIYA